MSNILDYITTEENKYQTVPVPIIEGYEWSMFKHVKLTTLYLNSIYETGNSDDKPYKNIILDKVNLQHRAIEFDVKDVDAFVDNPDNYYKSMLTRKFHARWARQNGIGEFFDRSAEIYTDFGGVLAKKNLREAKPEIIAWNKIAFVDQTDIVNNPICLRHFYTPDQLLAENWDKEESKYLITMASERNDKKETAQSGQTIESPNVQIKVYELHGVLPETFLDEDGDPFTYVRQMHIVGAYKDKDGKNQSVTLFKGKQKENLFKLAKRDPIDGRALGRGGVEELFEDQVWVNYNEIQQKALLDQASKILYQTADKSFTTRNKKIADLQQGDVLIHEENMPVSQINTQAVNFPLFASAMQRWDEHAKTVSGAYDVIAGESPKSGTAFRTVAVLNQEAHSLHKYRKQGLGRWIEEIYRDWILEFLVDEMRNEQIFMDTLSQEEMEEIANNLAIQEANRLINERVSKLELPTQEEVDALKEGVKMNFMAGGNKRFFKILKDELKDLPIDVQILITDEQRNNAFIADKLSSVFGQVAQNPTILQDPYARKLFNEIMELSGLSPIQYSQSMKTQTPSVAPPKAEQTTTVDSGAVAQ